MQHQRRDDREPFGPPSRPEIPGARTERVFARLALPVRPGDRVTFSDGQVGIVDTVKIADDLRDAKCTVLMEVGDDVRPNARERTGA
jgi:hypothetical protein